MNRGSSVTVVTRLRAGRPGLNSRQGQWWNFSLCHRIHTGSVARLASYPMGIREAKQLGREAVHSPQTSAEVKNAWSYTSTHPYVFMALW